MSNQFNQSLLNTNILTSGNSFEDAEFSGNSVFSDTIDLTGITSITGLVDDITITEASGVISVKNLGITNSKINDMSVSKLTSGTATGTGAYVISGITLENNNITLSGTVDGIDISANIDQAVKTTSSPTFVAVSTDTINERSTNNGVFVDGVLLKDGKINVSYIDGALNPFDQDLNTTNLPTFAGLQLTDNMDTGGNNITMTTGGIYGAAGTFTGYLQAPITYSNTIQNYSGNNMIIQSVAGGKIDVYASGNLFMNTGFYCNDSNAYIRNSSDTSKILKFDSSGISASTTRTLTAPNASGTLVLDTNTMTISNKTFPCGSTVFEQDASYLKWDISGMATGATATISIVAGGSYTYTFPDVGSASRTVAYTTGTQTFDGKTLTNASLTGPVITNPTIYTNSGSATITLPTSTDTLVGKNTTDILTNKSFSDSTCYFVDSADNTKKILLNVDAGQTGNSTFQCNFPYDNSGGYTNDSFLMTSLTQTVINKTINTKDNTIRNHCIVFQNGTAAKQTITAGSFATVQFNTTIVDTTGGSTTLLEADLANERIYVRKAGTVFVFGSVRIDGTSGTTFRELSIFKNSTNMNCCRESVVSGTQFSICGIYTVSANDYFNLQIFTTTNNCSAGDGSNLQTMPQMGVIWLSA